MKNKDWDRSFARASDYIDQRKPKQAKILLEKLVQNDSEPERVAIAAAQLGTAYLQLDRFEEAKAAFDKCIANATAAASIGERLWALACIGLLELAQGREVDGIRILEEVIVEALHAGYGSMNLLKMCESLAKWYEGRARLKDMFRVKHEQSKMSLRVGPKEFKDSLKQMMELATTYPDVSQESFRELLRVDGWPGTMDAKLVDSLPLFPTLDTSSFHEQIIAQAAVKSAVRS